ncbi:MAG TPA: replication initiator [Streptosporangiaceae bacterium]
MPLAKDVARTVAENNGVCIRPVPVKRVDLVTGDAEIIDVPCGHTLASVCPACAERKRRLRLAQCREGWHLTDEPILDADPPTDEHQRLVEERADLTAARDELAANGLDTANVDELINGCDDAMAKAGVRGSIDPVKTKRRTRSTRRRQDTPDLPRRPVDKRTVGKTFTGNDGRTFRPSIFLTLTCDTYGRVRGDGTPVDSSTYDYVRAARDALHFSKLVDRFVQNLRRFLGWEVQYFATVEPQRRLAPHVHMAIRGTVSRAELRQVAAATYHQVWWPSTDIVRYQGADVPVWDAETSNYCDPITGEVLPSWDEALDDLDADPDAEPLHVVRFGPQIDAQGVVAGSEDANRCLRYLAKYLTKSIADCHEPETDAQKAHVDRLCDALRYEPCSSSCANWLRYGIQPDNPRDGLRPGYCKSKAHRRQHLGYAGRRVLVSRKWSGKTLGDHKHERKAWVLAQLERSGVPATHDDNDPGRYAWAAVNPSNPEVAPLEHRILRAVAKRHEWRTQMELAQRRADGQPDTDLSATGLAA